MDEPESENLERLRDAVDRKSEEARAASEAPPEHGGVPGDPAGVEGDQHSLTETGRPQDVQSVRDKNTGKGKKTADKWNQ